MHTVSDILIRIKNAQSAQKERLLLPFSKMSQDIAKILKETGFIEDFEKRKRKVKKTEHSFLEIRLVAQAIAGVRVVSKPSRRIYIKRSAIKPVLGGYGVAIISTPKGVMTGEAARKNNLGGEWLAEVW